MEFQVLKEAKCGRCCNHLHGFREIYGQWGFSSFFIKISAVEIQVLIEAKCGCRCNHCVLIDLFIVMRVLYCL